MRSIGQDHAGIEKFCAFMNIPKPLAKKNYAKLVNTIALACKKPAQDAMLEAASELKRNHGNKEVVVDTSISCDGSWQRRGFSSLNGFVSAISMDSGKIVDIEPMSRYCRQCSTNEKLKQTDLITYNTWKATHTNCFMNYKGSAPNMEAVGAERIFDRSIEQNKLQYTELYGDGDSKTFPVIEKIYLKKGLLPK